MSFPQQASADQTLEFLATEWASGRGAMLETTSDFSSESSQDGIGFLYRWSPGSEPIRVSFGSQSRALGTSTSDNMDLFLGTRVGQPDVLELRALGQAVRLQEIRDAQLARQINETMAQAGTLTRDQTHLPSSFPILIAGQQLVALALQASRATSPSAESPRLQARIDFVEELHQWMSEELRKSIKLGDAAKQFGKSPRQLIRILKETTGTGFAEHLNMNRLKLARELLMNTSDSIMEIAGRTGFNSREQFIRSFSKSFGWTPLQFRKAWNQASLKQEDLTGLCRILGRTSVTWCDSEPPATPNPGPPQTLAVTNALHEIVEIFSEDAIHGTRRVGVLERGAMLFINRDLEGSLWSIHAPGSGIRRRFVTVAGHSLAVIAPS